jgi:hypothetical protein
MMQEYSPGLFVLGLLQCRADGQPDRRLARPQRRARRCRASPASAVA